MNFAETEGYIPKKRRREQVKDNKLAIATIAHEDMEIPTKIRFPRLPDSLEAWTKKTQVLFNKVN